MQHVLVGAGYRTHVHHYGADAFELVKWLRPDLVILDLWLEQPELGELVLLFLAQDPLTQRIPVIICSADLGLLRAPPERFQERGYVLVPKPFEPAQLLGAIRKKLTPS